MSCSPEPRAPAHTTASDTAVNPAPVTGEDPTAAPVPAEDADNKSAGNRYVFSPDDACLGARHAFYRGTLHVLTAEERRRGGAAGAAKAGASGTRHVFTPRNVAGAGPRLDAVGPLGAS